MFLGFSPELLVEALVELTYLCGLLSWGRAEQRVCTAGGGKIRRSRQRSVEEVWVLPPKHPCGRMGVETCESFSAAGPRNCSASTSLLTLPSLSGAKQRVHNSVRCSPTPFFFSFLVKSSVEHKLLDLRHPQKVRWAFSRC